MPSFTKRTRTDERAPLQQAAPSSLGESSLLGGDGRFAFTVGIWSIAIRAWRAWQYHQHEEAEAAKKTDERNQARRAKPGGTSRHQRLNHQDDRNEIGHEEEQPPRAPARVMQTAHSNRKIWNDRRQHDDDRQWAVDACDHAIKPKDALDDPRHEIDDDEGK